MYFSHIGLIGEQDWSSIEASSSVELIYTQNKIMMEARNNNSKVIAMSMKWDIIQDWK